MRPCREICSRQCSAPLLEPPCCRVSLSSPESPACLREDLLQLGCSNEDASPDAKIPGPAKQEFEYALCDLATALVELSLVFDVKYCGTLSVRSTCRLGVNVTKIYQSTSQNRDSEYSGPCVRDAPAFDVCILKKSFRKAPSAARRYTPTQL